MRRTTRLWQVFVTRFQEAFEQYEKHRLNRRGGRGAFGHVGAQLPAAGAPSKLAAPKRWARPWSRPRRGTGIRRWKRSTCSNGCSAKAATARGRSRAGRCDGRGAPMSIARVIKHP
jgi:hypothetical protein